jgi:hypothetical protein
MIVGLCGQAGAGKDTVADFLVKNHGFVKVALADPLKRICRDVFAFTDEQLWGPSSERNKPDERYLRTDGKEGPYNRWTYTCMDCRKQTTFVAQQTITCAGCGANFRRLNNCQNWREAEPEYLTPRYALQQLGTEWGRTCYPNIWIEYALRVAKVLLLTGPSGRDDLRTDGMPIFRYGAREGLQPAYTYPGDTPKGVVISDVRFLNEVDAIRAAGGHIWRIERPGAGLTGAAAQHVSEQEQNSIAKAKIASVLNNQNGPLGELEALVSKELSALGFIYPDQK